MQRVMLLEGASNHTYETLENPDMAVNSGFVYVLTKTTKINYSEY